MSDIYAQHRAAFAQVEAFVILKDGERVATIAFKFPRDGAGRLYAYVHWIGNEMVRGQATGGGYDKRSAAASAAARRIRHGAADEAQPSAAQMDDWRLCNRFVAALERDAGQTWDSALREAGFTVLQAV